jgi:hypothetical protein
MASAPAKASAKAFRGPKFTGDGRGMQHTNINRAAAERNVDMLQEYPCFVQHLYTPTFADYLGDVTRALAIAKEDNRDVHTIRPAEWYSKVSMYYIVYIIHYIFYTTIL